MVIDLQSGTATPVQFTVKVTAGPFVAPETWYGAPWHSNPAALFTYVPENAPVEGSTNHTVRVEPLVFAQVENGVI